MKIQTQFRLRYLAMATICLAVVAFGNEAMAQSGSRQGSDSTNPPPSPGGDPFQGFGEEEMDDDKFTLPGGVPPLQNDTPGDAAGSQRMSSFQEEKVNDKYAGWRQVSDGSDGNRLSEIIRSHWVMANELGTLNGIVYGIEGADVGNLKITLLNGGREVTSTRPKEDGSFSFANVRQGTYALVGWGDNAFFAFGFNILRYNPEADANVPQELKVTATPNETTINTDWIKFYAGDVKFPVYGTFEVGEDESDPPRLYGVSGQSLFLPESRPATSISSHLVTPSSDGRVIGRVHQLSTRDGRPVDLRNTRILLLKDDDVYAAVTSDAYGAFEFPEIPAGEYSVVAIGRDGMGCIGMYLGEAGDGDEEFAPLSFAMMPSETTGWLNDLANEQAYLRVISRPIFDMNDQQQQSSYGQFGCQNGCGGGALRPGGYRPGPRSAIPSDQRFLKRANRFVDGLFFRDAQIPPSAGGFNSGGFNSGGFNGGFNGPVNTVPGGVIQSAPGPTAAPSGGSASRIEIPPSVNR